MTWKEIKIGDIGNIITGNTPPKNSPEYLGKEYKFIKPTDMGIGMRYTPVTEEYYSNEGYKKYESSLIPPLSTCVVTIGSIGKKMTLTDDYCFINQAVNAVIPNQEKYDPFFVYYILKNNLHKVKAADTGASSGRENVSKSNFSNLTLLVPEDKATQNKIASILSAYDDLIENNLKRIKLLEEAAQNIYKEWFVYLRFPNYENLEFEEGFPKRWTKKNINDVISIKYGKNLPTAIITPTGKFPVYGASGIIGYYEEKNMNQKVALITSRGNGSGDIHRTHEEESFITNNSFTTLPQNGYEYLPFFFITELLKTLNLKNYCSGSAQPQITNTAMNNIEIILPEKEIILKYSMAVSCMLDLSDTLLYQNQKLKEARDILLPRLMNRTIEV